MAISQWSSASRPRERLLSVGAQALSDEELLAIFLRTGIAGYSAVDLARQLLRQFGSIHAVLRADFQQFSLAPGMGLAKYTQLQAALELARRFFAESEPDRPLMASAEWVRKDLQLRFWDKQREIFAGLFLDSQYRLLHYQELFFGTLDRSPVYPREIAKLALLHNAKAVMVAHNHPSGHCQPSAADKQITEAIAQALRLLDIQLLDHWIIAAQQSFSFAEYGLL